MNIGNIVGALALGCHHPQLVRPFTNHLRNRVTHPWTRKHRYHIPPPEQITLVVTDICNLRCKMCQYAYSDAPGYQLNQTGHMPLTLFQKIMAEAPGHPIISFTGGEPLLHPHITEMIAYAQQKGRLTTLTTNGWQLAKRATSLCQAGLAVLVVSVDGPEDTHNQIRGGKAFARLVDGLQTIRQQRRRPILFVNMTLSNLNHDKIWDVYQMAKAWGVDGLNFNHLWMQTSDMIEQLHQQFPGFSADEVAWDIKPQAVNVSQLADQLEAVRRQNKFESMLVTELPWLTARQIATWYQHPTIFVKYGSTRCAWTRMKIWPDGRVKPCREWVAGNITQTHMMEVWQGEKFNQFRQLLTRHKTIPLCSRCCYMTHR